MFLPYCQQQLISMEKYMFNKNTKIKNDAARAALPIKPRKPWWLWFVPRMVLEFAFQSFLMVPLNKWIVNYPDLIYILSPLLDFYPFSGVKPS